MGQLSLEVIAGMTDPKMEQIQDKENFLFAPE
jgi:hypothetical protein